MGFEVKEPKIVSCEHVPGTSLLVDIGGGNVELVDDSNLKHARGKNSDMILVPQPSDSPNDSLLSGTASGVQEEFKLMTLL
jgi:MFS family permease